MGRGETNKGYVGTKVCLSDQFEVEKKKEMKKLTYLLFLQSVQRLPLNTIEREKINGKRVVMKNSKGR